MYLPFARLRDLNCWGVTGMTDAVLEAIAAQGTLEDATPPPLLLETMNLGQCSQITDKVNERNNTFEL